MSQASDFAGGVSALRLAFLLLERRIYVHFFTNRYRTLFKLRTHRANLKHFMLNQRLRNTLALDYLEGAVRINKFSMNGCD